METSLEYAQDILGPDYAAHTFDLGADPDGESGNVVATLVKHVAGPKEPHHAVLYVHGFSDYFFQTELAEFYASRGYAFYALDLRKYGRSMREGQSPNYISDLAFYDRELDLAVEAISTEHPDLGIVVMAHSTGGLITPLWLDRRRQSGRTAPVVGLVLNSPWFDLQGSAVLREVATPVLKVIGKAAGTRPLPIALTGVYGRTLHSSADGEWDFDLSKKPLDGFPARFGWIRAVRLGHTLLHRGIDTSVTSLVMRSSHSLTPKTVTPEAHRADVVLDTRQIAKWAGTLGYRQAAIPITDAKHDIFLSEKSVRDEAYEELAAWLEREIEK